MKKQFKFGIIIEDVKEGLLVKQYEKKYIARNWKITKEVIDMISLCLDSGMRWMIRENHPKRSNLFPNKKGVVYLAFSPTKENQWSLAIDTFNPNSKKFRFGVFNGKYRTQFDKYKVPYKFERRNKTQGHMEVSREKLFMAIKTLSKLDHSVLFFNKKQIQAEGFIQETDMQRYLILNWKKTPFSKYDLIGDEYPVTSGRNTKRIDLFGYYKKSNTYIIIELKKHEANQDALEQVNNYYKILKKKIEFKKSKFCKVLIAERIAKDIKIKATEKKIDTYEMNWPGLFKKI